MEAGLIPVFSDIFKGEKLPDISELLKNIPSVFTLNAVSFINSRLMANSVLTVPPISVY